MSESGTEMALRGVSGLEEGPSMLLGSLFVALIAGTLVALK